MASEAPAGKNLLNAQFEPARTQLDWLTRAIAVVDAFINDPLCFAQLQPASFAAFLGAALRLSDPAGLGKIRADLPIYLFSGSEDPSGNNWRESSFWWSAIVARVSTTSLRIFTRADGTRC